MPPTVDTVIATTLSRTAHRFIGTTSGSSAGRSFEQALYHAALNAHEWHHTAGPGQRDMGLLGTSRTGTRYEYDGVFGTDDTLYIVEAKRLAGAGLKRDLVAIFIQRLLDTVLGSEDVIGHLRVQAVMVSALPDVDTAAVRLAVAWGILLISPARVTPFEILYEIQRRGLATPAARELQSECEQLGGHLWRSLNRRVWIPGQEPRAYVLDAEAVYDARRIQGVIEQWDQSVERARSLGVVA